MKNPKPCDPTDLLDEMAGKLTSEKISEAEESIRATPGRLLPMAVQYGNFNSMPFDVELKPIVHRHRFSIYLVQADFQPESKRA